jgi:hypothetical protein
MGVCSSKPKKGKLKITKFKIPYNINDLGSPVRTNSSKKSFFSELENFTFFKNIKDEENIKMLTLKEGCTEYKYLSDWESILRISDTKHLSTFSNKKYTAESTSTTEWNTSPESNFNSINSVCSSFLQQNKISLLLEISYRQEKKRICRLLQNGPPNNLRWLVWNAIARVNYKLEDKIYNQFKMKHLSSNLTDQIKKDLHRTAPEVTYFQTEEGRKNLFNVLKALAIYDKELAYCQGINILAANILLVSDGNEPETFQFLCYLFSGENGLNLKEFYTRGFPKLHLFIYISKNLIRDYLLPIYRKIEEIIPPDHDEIWIFKWIQSLFSLIIDFSINVRLWDCILANGLNFIFYFILGFLKFFENEILIAEEMVDFVCIFKNNQVINNKNNISTINEALVCRDKLINLSIGFKNKINEKTIDIITKKYYSDSAVVNQYLLNDSYCSDRMRQIETQQNLANSDQEIFNCNENNFSYRVNKENLPIGIL